MARVVKESGRPVQSVQDLMAGYERERLEKANLSKASPMSTTFLKRGGAVPFNAHGLPQGMAWVRIRPKQ